MTRSSAISGSPPPVKTPRCKRDRQLYRPVSKEYRDGELTDELVCASVKTFPSAAN
nr:hypothetical protein [Crateriforma conspicua]